MRIPKVIVSGIAPVIVLGALAGACDSASSDEPEVSTVPTSTAAVERRDLVERESVDGTLGYGDTFPVTSARSGTITALLTAGTIVQRGQSLVEIDGRGLPLLLGERPMWRPLASGADDGPDIRQLEENLAALGFAPESMTIDEHWDARTTTAVKRRQESLGLDETGVVAPSDLVFLPAAVRIASVQARVGDSAAPGAVVYEGTGTERIVTLDLDASRRSIANVGDVVQVELPSRDVVEGIVREVGAVATVDQQADADPTIEVTVGLGDSETDGGLDQTPVDVQFTRQAATDVLAVPVRALLALAEGGYAVEVVDGLATRLVAVETGAFADGWVEVTGELVEGDDVVAPE